MPETGNTILLTVSTVGTVDVLIMLTGISLGSFLFAAFLFGRLGHYFGESNSIEDYHSLVVRHLMPAQASIGQVGRTPLTSRSPPPSLDSHFNSLPSLRSCPRCYPLFPIRTLRDPYQRPSRMGNTVPFRPHVGRPSGLSPSISMPGTPYCTYDVYLCRPHVGQVPFRRFQAQEGRSEE
jgi:hypothetical protein